MRGYTDCMKFNCNQFIIKIQNIEDIYRRQSRKKGIR